MEVRQEKRQVEKVDGIVGMKKINSSIVPGWKGDGQKKIFKKIGGVEKRLGQVEKDRKAGLEKKLEEGWMVKRLEKGWMDKRLEKEGW